MPTYNNSSNISRTFTTSTIQITLEDEKSNSDYMPIIIIIMTVALLILLSITLCYPLCKLKSSDYMSSNTDAKNGNKAASHETSPLQSENQNRSDKTAAQIVGSI